MLLATASRAGTLPPADLASVLPSIFTTLGVAAKHERIDLRQPASHGLARLAAAMATPAPEDVKEVEAEGASVEDLAQATAAAVPASVGELLAALLADKVMEVRMSALHAVKTLCKLQPPLLRASGCRLARVLAPGIVSNCQDKRHMQVEAAAKRTLMHLALTCGWTEPEIPDALLRTDKESGTFIAEFAKRTLKRLSGLESEAEYSDEEYA